MSKLSGEEREILEGLDKGSLKRYKMAADTQKRHQEYARSHVQKRCAN